MRHKEKPGKLKREVLKTTLIKCMSMQLIKKKKKSFLGKFANLLDITK